MNVIRLTLSLALFGLVCGTVRADEDVRFSKSLEASEFSAAGLAQLSSDQLAVLDALVRRDITQSRFVSKEPRAPRFSERLTTNERENAGLALLSPAELTALDSRVETLIAPPPSPSTQRFATTNRYAVPSVKIDRGPQVHGELSLMVAAGSDGYRAYGGGIAVTLDDPSNKFALTLAYSEIHSEGGHPYRYCGDRYHGRFFDPLGWRY
jgi:hypothetical protein